MLHTERWNTLPARYREAFIEMQKGGVKDSTDMRYIKNFAEFWRTMRKLGIEDRQVWSFPTDEWLLQVYIVDCAIVREKPNTYDTIRSKLRSVDYVGQCLNVKQEYHKSPALDAVIKYCKKRNKGKGSDTIPITVEKVKLVVCYILCTKINQEQLDSWDRSSLSKNWMIYDLTVFQEEEREWYQLCIIVVLAVSLGLRGAEQLRNEEEQWKEYGIKLKDMRWLWKGKLGKRFSSSKYTKNTTNLSSVEIKLRNSKTKGIGEAIKLLLGRNETEIKPLLLVYEWYHMRKEELGNDWKNEFLFTLSLQKVKKMWKSIIKQMQILEPEKWRYHGLRKGFATSLQQRDINQGLIAFGGRWSLVASIYRYTIYTLEDMLPLAAIIWDRERETLEHKDLDNWELEMLKNVKKLKNMI